MNQWDAERVVEAPLARALIEEQFPQLAPVELQQIGLGWDNTVFQVGEDRVFRFPRREIAVPLLETEWRVLPALAGHLSLTIPEPLHHGKATKRFPWPFLGQRLVPGRTACTLQLGEQERRDMAGPLGRFLAELHATPADLPGLGPDTMGRMDLVKRLERVQEDAARAHAEGLLDAPGALVELAKRCAVEAPAREPSVVHGDLYVRHLMVGDERHLTGVIDWGDVHRGDPSVDLALAHTFLPRDAHEDFREAHGELDDATWRRATFRAVYHTLAVLLYGHSSGDGPLEGEARRSLAQLLDAA